jgi:predicted nuclease of restriction endonuclease-like (RecB) superfamily
VARPPSELPPDHAALLVQIKARIGRGQLRASLAVNAEMILLYWDIGRMIYQRQLTEGWGAKVIPELSRAIRAALPGMKGFSQRNIRRMVAFFREYEAEPPVRPEAAGLPPSNSASVIWPQAVAKLPKYPEAKEIGHLTAQIPWGHLVYLMERVKDRSTRHWYMWQVIDQGWSRNILQQMVRTHVHARQGAGVNNFDQQLSGEQSGLVGEMLKDPYVFDFLTLSEPFREKELESALIKHLEEFLIELGRGFSFVGRQHCLKVAGQEFFLDLLFYHLKLRCYLVIELKKGPFKPEYAGKVNFYCSAVDDRIKAASDRPTIGLILCEENNQVLAEYSLRGIHRPIGVSEYELTTALPSSLQSSLPSVEEIEAELNPNIEP